MDDLRDVDKTDDQRPTSVRYLVLGLVAFASASAYLTRYCISVANTTIERDLMLTPAQMGQVMAAFQLGYFVCQVPGGWLGSRIGTRAAFALLSVGWSAATIWTAGVVLYMPLLVSRTAFGMAQAGLVPISAQVLRDWIPTSLRGTSSATIAASMSIGGAVTMGLTGVLLKYIDWRTVFFMYSIVGIVWAIVYYVLVRTYPRDHRWVNQAELDLIHETVTPAHTDDERTLNSDSDRDSGVDEQVVPHATESAPAAALKMLTSLSMWGVCIQSFFRAAGYQVFASWFPSFLEKGYGVSTESAGLMTMAPMIGVVVGSLVGGGVIDWLLHRTGSKRVSRSLFAFVALTACGLLTYAASWTATASQLVGVMAVAAALSGLGSPAAWAATIDISGRYTAVVMGVMNMAGTVGGMLMTTSLGFLVTHIENTNGNWNHVVYVSAVVYLLAAVSWLIVHPDRGMTEN